MAEKTIDLEKLKAFQGRPSQAEVNYKPLSMVAGKACANCRWFMNDGCWIIEDYFPEPVIATGYCDRWEGTPEASPAPVEALVEAVEGAMETVSELAELVVESREGEPEVTPITSEPVEPVTDTSKPRKSIKSILDKVFRQFMPEHGNDAFSVFKGLDGIQYWHAVFTNNFEDREGEIITERAIDDYIERVDAGIVPLPMLMAYHVPNTEHGQATMVWRSGHFVHSVGTFYDDPVSQKAVKFYQKNAPKLKMSHTFISSKSDFDGKHYHSMNTVEITTLPADAAANPFTSFEEFIKMAKELPPHKLAYLKQLFGEERATELSQIDEQFGKSLEGMKIAYKDFAEMSPDDKPAADQSEQEKALSAVYGDLVAGVSDVAAVVKAMESKFAKDLETLRAENKSLTDQLAAVTQSQTEIRKQINLAPARAAHASATVKETDSGLGDALPTDSPVQKLFAGTGIKIKEGN